MVTNAGGTGRGPRPVSVNLRIEETMMKWLRLCLLLLLTLAVMRAGSWAMAWTVLRLVPVNVRRVAVSANVLAFATFVLLLYVSLLPGEPIDWAAIWFGLIVFAIYTIADFFWRPWDRRVRTRQ